MVDMHLGCKVRTAGWLLPLSALLAVALLAGVVSSGCGEKKTTRRATQPSRQSTKPSTQPAAGPTGPVILSGGGSEASQPFNLSEGVALFTFQYSGGSQFRAVLLDSTGRQVEVLADVDTNTNGSTAAGVKSGQYVVDVTAAGAWEIDVEQATPAVTPYTPLTFNGTGPLATEFFQSPGENADFIMNFTGTSEFTVKLLNSTGETVNTVADTTGPYSATVTIPLASGVAYLVDVEAVGTWTLTVQ